MCSTVALIRPSQAEKDGRAAHIAKVNIYELDVEPREWGGSINETRKYKRLSSTKTRVEVGREGAHVVVATGACLLMFNSRYTC